jgi:hypothetical protein
VLLNDDGPEVRLANASVREGAVGTTNALVQLTLSGVAPWTVEAWVRTVPGTASAGEDYLAREAWVVFAPGETVRTLGIPVVGDTLIEAPETLGVSLVQVVGGVPGVATASVTIQNDDVPPQPTIRMMWGGAGVANLEFPTVIGATYQLQTRTNLTQGTWRSVGIPIVGSGEPGRIQLAAPLERETYYRIRAQ